MTLQKVRDFYIDKKDTPCPLTEQLIKFGYQQKSSGYINMAKKMNQTIDYSKALPTQYWHLMSYYDKYKLVANNKHFTKTIKCGELIFLMAEVSNCINTIELETLLKEIISSGKKIETKIKTKSTKVKSNMIYDRANCNKKIQEICFDRIYETIIMN